MIQGCILAVILPDNLLKLYQICFMISLIDIALTWSFTLSWLSNWEYNNLLLLSNFLISGSQGWRRWGVSLIDGDIRFARIEFRVNNKEMFCILFYNLYIFTFRWACYYSIYYFCYSCCYRRFCNHKNVISSYSFNKILLSIFSSGPHEDYN